jgi:SAM-dependent methyltransferase
VRDTDADWRAISEVEPYFGVLSGAQFLRANLSVEAKANFYATGDAEIGHLLSTIRNKILLGFTPHYALDFGCGVGRLALAMGLHAEKVVGVDVSEWMLKAAEQERSARGVKNVLFQLDLPSGGYDWVNTSLVLQHIAPARGYELVAALLGGLTAGGVASIHVTAFRTVSHLESNFRDIAFLSFDGERMNVLQEAPQTAPGEMRMYDYDMTKVLSIFVNAGLGGLWIEHIDHGGHHAFRLYGRKS